VVADRLNDEPIEQQIEAVRQLLLRLGRFDESHCIGLAAACPRLCTPVYVAMNLAAAAGIAREYGFMAVADWILNEVFPATGRTADGHPVACGDEAEVGAEDRPSARSASPNRLTTGGLQNIAAIFTAGTSELSNDLTVILSAAGVAGRHLPRGHPACALLRDMESAANRAASRNALLLAFAGWCGGMSTGDTEARAVNPEAQAGPRSKPVKEEGGVRRKHSAKTPASGDRPVSMPL
jgi:hypothetical protein